MKQQADKEMVAIRRITETLQALEPAARARVLGYVASRVNDMPAPQPTNDPQPTQLPFPDAEKVKAAVAATPGPQSFDLFAPGATKVPTLGGSNG